MSEQALDVQKAFEKATGNLSDKPLAIILAGHNGSGKSTLWYVHLADTLKIPLINADRMMLSILPERGQDGFLRQWAQELRDTDDTWMVIAQKGVEAFVAQAMSQQATFAMETVFSYWKEDSDGKVHSKIDTIKKLQRAGYFVLLMFVGLSNVGLSVGRVQTRKQEGGHDVNTKKLYERFPRTQRAIQEALKVADASILVDNSRSTSEAFTVVHARTKAHLIFDLRKPSDGTAISNDVPKVIKAWIDKVAPMELLPSSSSNRVKGSPK